MLWQVLMLKKTVKSERYNYAFFNDFKPTSKPELTRPAGLKSPILISQKVPLSHMISMKFAENRNDG